MIEKDSLTVCGDVDPGGLAAVNQLLNDGVIESAWYGDSTASTNTLALAELNDGVSLPSPRLLLTDRQTAGRGRRGRDWLSSDQTLTFSVVIDGPADAAKINLLSLAVGVGIARGLEFDFAPLRARLKWPNDVYIGGGKVAGVLLETSANISNRVVIGVGLNIGAPPKINDSAMAAPVCSLVEATGRSMGRYDCFASVVSQMMTTLLDPDDITADFQSRCALTGEMIQFLEGSHPREGLCLGIDDQGELIVKLENETKTLRSGEVQLIRHRSNR